MANTILYEKKLDPTFRDIVAGMPEGETIASCIQCGTCSATCPVAQQLEHTPRRLIAMIRAGMRDEVLGSATPWTCASCYKCTVQCPQEVKITDIMYALRRLAREAGIRPRDTAAWRFSRLFTDFVRRYGRGYELGLMVGQFLFHDPLALLKQAPVGMEMLREGRLPFLPHKVSDLEGFRKMVDRAVEIDASQKT